MDPAHKGMMTMKRMKIPFLLALSLSIPLPFTTMALPQARNLAEPSSLEGCWKKLPESRSESSIRVACFARAGASEWIVHKCKISAGPAPGQQFGCDGSDGRLDIKYSRGLISTPPVHTNYQAIPTWEYCKIGQDGRQLIVEGPCSLPGRYERADEFAFQEEPARSKSWLEKLF